MQIEALQKELQEKGAAVESVREKSKEMLRKLKAQRDADNAEAANKIAALEHRSRRGG
jgi:hypothetical protein